MSSPVRGFSKRTKQEKIDWLIEHHFHNDPAAKQVVESNIGIMQAYSNCTMILSKTPLATSIFLWG